MSRRLFPSLLALAALASPLPRPAEAAEPRRVAAAATPETREWAARIEGLVRDGGLALRTVRDDTLLPERQHARYVQLYKGVPVVGGDLAVQVSGADVVSVFGTLYDGIDLDAVPAFSADRRSRRSPACPASRSAIRPELVVLPQPAGGFALVYTLPVFTRRRTASSIPSTPTRARWWRRAPRSRPSPRSATATASSATTRR